MVGPAPVGGVAVLSVPGKSLSATVKVSSCIAAKRGFVTSLSVDEDRTRRSVCLSVCLSICLCTDLLIFVVDLSVCPFVTP